MWGEALATLLTQGVVEYGAYQRQVKPETPLWRRPTKGKRFATVEDALFNAQGVRNACLGFAGYPKERYSSGGQLFMPYAAAWLRGSPFAFLARPSAPNPEVTVVSTSHVAVIEAANEENLTNFLAALFGSSARQCGVRLLAANRRVEIPANDG